MATAKKAGLRKRRKAYRRDRPNAKLHYEGAVLVSIPESTKITGLGLTLTYQKVRDGTLPTVQINGRFYIHVPKLMQLLDSLGGTQSAA